MTSLTRQLRFYKNDVSRGFNNPMRRWFYHYLFSGVILGTGFYIWGQYKIAGWEAKYHIGSGKKLCSDVMLEFLLLFPFNYISHAFGRFSESVIIPESVHCFLINILVWWFSIDMSDVKEDKFTTLQEFFIRHWKNEMRPISQVPVTSPADGVILSIQENIENDQLIQVKGMYYNIQRLLRRKLTPVEEGKRRVAIVLHLRIKDYHHVISPVTFHCNEVIYIPGALLPHTRAGYHWIPSVLPLNERVVLLGRTSENNNNNNNNSNEITNIGLALVGGTLTGRIALHFDARVQTNFLNPPEYAIHRQYSTNPLLSKGLSLATFYWGSSVVLVMDVPKSALLSVKTGDIIKAGEALITY